MGSTSNDSNTLKVRDDHETITFEQVDVGGGPLRVRLARETSLPGPIRRGAEAATRAHPRHRARCLDQVAP